MVLCELTRCLERDKGATQQKKQLRIRVGATETLFISKRSCALPSTRSVSSLIQQSLCLHHDGPAEPAAEADSGRSLHSVKPLPGRQDRQQGVQWQPCERQQGWQLAPRQ